SPRQRRTAPSARQETPAPGESTAAAGTRSEASSDGLPTRPRPLSIHSYKSSGQTPSRRAARPAPPSLSYSVHKKPCAPFFMLPFQFLRFYCIGCPDTGFDLVVSSLCPAILSICAADSLVDPLMRSSPTGSVLNRKRCRSSRQPTTRRRRAFNPSSASVPTQANASSPP